MIKLNEEFVKNFDKSGDCKFSLIKKDESTNVAIFKRQNLETQHIAYEVHSIKTTPAGAKLPNNCVVEESFESLRGPEQFGKTAFYCNSIDRATERFNFLIEKINNNKAAEEAVEEVEEASEVKVETPGRRGRPSVTRSALVIPVGNFCMQDVVNKNPEYTKPVCYIELQKLIKQNKVEVIGNKDNASGRGKKIVIYQAVEA